MLVLVIPAGGVLTPTPPPDMEEEQQPPLEVKARDHAHLGEGKLQFMMVG